MDLKIVGEIVKLILDRTIGKVNEISISLAKVYTQYKELSQKQVRNRYELSADDV